MSAMQRAKLAARLLEMGRRIRAARREAGLSQAELAQRAGISRPAAVEIESGRRKVSSLELATLAQVLGRPAEYFTGDPTHDEENFGTTTVSHLARAARKLAPEDQEQLLRFAEYLRREARRRAESS